MTTITQSTVDTDVYTLKRDKAINAAQNDMKAKRREFLFGFEEGGAYDKYITETLCDVRDKPLFYMLMNCFIMSVPLALGLLFFAKVNRTGHMLGLAYFVFHIATFLHSYILALHYSSHRQLFKKNTDMTWFNYVAPYVLGPLFGIPAGMYYLHHVVMHHCHDNCIPYDTSSTETYQRDNVFHFFQYWLRFWTGVWLELPLFAAKMKYWKAGAQCVLSEIIYFSFGYFVYQVSPIAFIYAILMPFFFTQFMLAYGNWSQHIFVGKGKPSNYRSTYNCLDCYDNTKSFNDGYHVLHHNNSKLHWSAFPESYLTVLDKMNAEKAFSFVGIGFFEVGLLVFLGRLDKLAEYAVTPWDLDNKELVKIMKERLQPVKREKIQ